MKVKWKSKRILIPMIIVFLVVLVLSSFFKASQNNEYIDATATDFYKSDSDGDYYSNLVSKWEQDGIKDVKDFNSTVSVADYIISSGAEVVAVDDFRYGNLVKDYREDFRKGTNGVVYLKAGSEVSFSANIEKAGLYQLSFDFYDLEESILPLEFSLLINDEYPFFESRTLEISGVWRLSRTEFPLDRYGNEIQPISEKFSVGIIISLLTPTVFTKALNIILNRVI